MLQVGLDPGSVGMVRLLHLRLQIWIMNDYEITKERTWLWSVMDMRWVWELLVGFTMIRMSQRHERISILSMRAWEGDKITPNRTFVGLETASLGMVHQEMALSGEPLKWPSYEPLIHWNCGYPHVHSLAVSGCFMCICHIIVRAMIHTCVIMHIIWYIYI